MASEDLELLKRVRTRIENGWCQRAYARDVEGLPVDPETNPAAMYCILGAFRAEKKTSVDAVRLLSSCIPVHTVGPSGVLCEDGCRWPPHFNDFPDTTQQKVLGVVDCAIAKVAAETPA